MIRGLDAWNGQGEIPFEELGKQGFRFLLAKCQEGNKGKDPAFERNVKAAKDAGWYVGAYHFPYPLPHLSPEAQAELFFKASEVGSNVGEIPPSFDLEWPAPQDWTKWKCDAKQISEWARRCCERMTEIYGCHPIIYSYPWFMSALVKGGADIGWMKDYGWWPADYKVKGRLPFDGEQPFIPAPFKTWTFWQHDGDGGLVLPNGRDADFCLFNGSEEDLATLCAGYRQPPTLEGGIIHPYP